MTSEEFELLSKELRSIAENGYATAIDAVEVGLSSVAICLRNGEGAALGALVVAMPTIRFQRALDSGLLGQMRAAAKRITPDIRQMRPSDEP